MIKKVYHFYLLMPVLIVSDGLQSKNGEYEISKPAPRVIIGAKVWRIENNLQYLHFENGQLTLYANRLEYAPIRQLAFRTTIPIIIHQTFNHRTSAGFGEISATANWRWILHNNFSSVIRAGLKFPTTDTSIVPRLGSGSVDVILELENVFLSKHWFFSPFLGALITTENKHIKRGTNFFYNFEFARRIDLADWKKTRFFFGGISNAVYSAKDSINGIQDPNSGGFFQTFGGLFALSKRNHLLIATLEFPLVQRNFGIQRKLDFRARMSYQLFIF